MEDGRETDTEPGDDGLDGSRSEPLAHAAGATGGGETDTVPPIGGGPTAAVPSGIGADGDGPGEPGISVGSEMGAADGVAFCTDGGENAGCGSATTAADDHEFASAVAAAASIARRNSRGTRRATDEGPRRRRRLRCAVQANASGKRSSRLGDVARSTTLSSAG